MDMVGGLAFLAAFLRLVHQHTKVCNCAPTGGACARPAAVAETCSATAMRKAGWVDSAFIVQ